MLINPIAAAEALKRYDEEHLKPPHGSVATAYEGVGAWIPDPRELHVTFVGSNMEMRVKAGELRAIDRPLQCKIALDALKADPKVLAGTLEVAPSVAKGHGSGGSDFVGVEPGATGFARAPWAVGAAASDAADGPTGGGGGGGFDGFRNGHSEFSFDGLGAGGMMDGGGGDGSIPKQRRRKKKKSVVAEDGVAYDLPIYVQNVETKQHRSTLRLKMPLTGFLVNGEDVSVADLVVAYGLDVTRKNLLALRYDTPVLYRITRMMTHPLGRFSKLIFFTVLVGKM